MDQTSLIERHIPYRLRAISTMGLAWRWWSAWENPKQAQVLFDGVLAIEGNSYAILNPILDSGFVHARALLEFLGFRVSNGRLVNIKSRRSDDIGIEQIAINNKKLKMLTPEVAFSAYSGPAEEAERSLLAIFHIANKGFAHFTSGLQQGEWFQEDIAIACEGIPILVINHLYVPLGLPAPEYEVRGRKREV